MSPCCGYWKQGCPLLPLRMDPQPGELLPHLGEPHDVGISTAGKTIAVVFVMPDHRSMSHFAIIFQVLWVPGCVPGGNHHGGGAGK